MFGIHEFLQVVNVLISFMQECRDLIAAADLSLSGVLRVDEHLALAYD